jgi:predicted  nucleic acid-binding Zn-ribbon protein
VIRAEDEEKRKIGAIIAKHKMKRDMWRDIEAETLQELEPMKAAYDRAVIELAELEHQHSTKEAEIKAVEQQVAKHRDMIAETTRTMSDQNVVGDAFVKAAQTKQTWESSLAILEKDHRTPAGDIDALLRRISIRKSEVAALKTSLATKTGTACAPELTRK